MATESEITIFSWIGRQIENVTNHMIIGNVTSFIDLLSPFIVLCVTVYIMGRAYLCIMGKEDSALEDLCLHCFTVIVVTTLALNVENYTTYIMGGIRDIEISLASAITDSKDSNETVFKSLDDLLAKSIEQISYCWDQFTFIKGSTWTWLMLAFTMMIAYTIITVIAGVMIIGAKFLLSIFLMLGPVFVTAFIFPWSRKFFDNWIGKVLENILVMTLGVLIITSCMAIFDEFISMNPATDKDVSPIGLSLTLGVVTIILCYVLRQVPSIAAALAGGIATEALKVGAPKLPKRKTKDETKNDKKNDIKDGSKNTPNHHPANMAIRERIEEHNRRAMER